MTKHFNPSLTRTTSYSSSTSSSSSTTSLPKHEAFSPSVHETAPWWLGEEGYEKWTSRWLEDNDAKNCLLPVGVKTFGQLRGFMASLRTQIQGGG
ncbi:hypothetical protein ONS95_008322 [Cadophora gregata]|uniref:uncharacterized protein n=1 Tax=Cadophora gregata TaxID=51156 RepID=UPI0026DC3DC8|nr:uncharacterized protein ONS95_008322 [Cadophora gregata]KAK0100368.1 hypothetical protein ONS96_007648 [Cadophora gregata f. sp. sojae]KAK0126742.1 hypothetical protein ONS95_008322 [Cadophora gregata]